MYKHNTSDSVPSTMRKAPLITISPSDYDTHSSSWSWVNRAMARRSRSLLFLATLVALGYFISGSVSGPNGQQRYLPQRPESEQQRTSIFPPTDSRGAVISPAAHPPQEPPSNTRQALADASSLQEYLIQQNDENGESPNATIGMVSMLYGDSSPAYERALQSHIDHGRLHGYRTQVLREKLLGRLWSKPAYMLSIVLNELQKPKEHRLKWLFWFDADTIVTNPKIPLEIFLPPSPEFDHIHFLCGDDHNGLNDGAFLLRVNDYSMHLMAAALTVESFRPEVDLRYSEQSAIEHVVQSEDIVRPWENFSYTDGYARIPQRWMNAYMGPRTEYGGLKPGKQITGNSVKEGDMLLHFAGSGETKRRCMTTFMDTLDKARPTWELDVAATDYEAEIAAFWKEWAIVEEKRHRDNEEKVKKLDEEEEKKAEEKKKETEAPLQNKQQQQSSSTSPSPDQPVDGTQENHQEKKATSTADTDTDTAKPNTNNNTGAPAVVDTTDIPPHHPPASTKEPHYKLHRREMRAGKIRHDKLISKGSRR